MFSLRRLARTVSHSYRLSRSSLQADKAAKTDSVDAQDAMVFLHASILRCDFDHTAGDPSAISVFQCWCDVCNRWQNGQDAKSCR